VKNDKNKGNDNEKENDKEKENRGEGDAEKTEKASHISSILFNFNFWLHVRNKHYIFVLAASINEDLRQLKDFKAMISEKTVPKSIKILKRTVWALGMILIILTGWLIIRIFCFILILSCGIKSENEPKFKSKSRNNFYL